MSLVQLKNMTVGWVWGTLLRSGAGNKALCPLIFKRVCLGGRTFSGAGVRPAYEFLGSAGLVEGVPKAQLPPLPAAAVRVV